VSLPVTTLDRVQLKNKRRNRKINKRFEEQEYTKKESRKENKQIEHKKCEKK
jgi:hypothetical protein